MQAHVSAFNPARRRFLRRGLFFGAACLCASYPVFIERNWVCVNRYAIPVAGLPAAFHGFTIAHLSDLHMGFLVSAAFVNAVIHQTNQLATDAIVCTGDYVHERNSSREIDQVWPLLLRLKARDGVFSVLGNHDHWADTARSLDWLERSGQNVRHRRRAIYRGKDRILIGGAGDLLEDDLGVDQAFADSEANDCRILLAHNPDSVDMPYRTPVSLVLSGHTHGGQIVLPFYGPPVVPVKNKRYTSGLITTSRTRVFISRGLGWSILPVRLNCPPEIAVLELQAAPPLMA